MTGSCEPDSLPWRPYHATETGHQFPNALSSLPQETLNGNNFRTCNAVILMNGDKCIPDQWVLIHSRAHHAPIIAQMKEAIQRRGSPADISSTPDAILLQCGKLQEIVKPYSMPSVRHDVSFLLLPIEVSHVFNRMEPRLRVSLLVE